MTVMPKPNKIEKHKGRDATYALADLPFIVTMGPTRTLAIESAEPFALRFKGSEMPDDGAGPKRVSRQEGGKHVIRFKLRNRGRLEYFEYDVVGVADPIIIIDPDLQQP